MATITQTDEKTQGNFVANWTPEEYHARCEFIGRSMLDDFRDSPRRYHGYYVAKDLERPQPTPAMRFGTLFHLCLLEPERFSASCFIAPETASDGTRWNRSKKDHKAEWADVLAECGNRTILEPDDVELLKSMHAGIDRSPVASSLLFGDGPTEQVIVWDDENTGLACKSMRDKLARSGTLIVDPKSCEDCTPEAFARQVASFGYHRQAAFYLEGHRQVFNEDPAGMVFVAVSKQPPFDVAVYELDYDALAIGHKQNQLALAQLATCLETGEWCAPHEKLITSLALPKWATYENDWRM